MTGRRLAPLAEVTGQITADGGSALAVPADVTDSQAMQAAVTAHEERFGRLDIVVANAGIVPVPGPVLDCPSAVWAEVLQTNLSSQHLIATTFGRIGAAARQLTDCLDTPDRPGFASTTGAAARHDNAQFYCQMLG